MVKHIVMWKFKDFAEGKSKEENISLVRDSLYALVGKIDEIKKMEIGADISHTDMSMDMVLLTEFESIADMKAYAVNPEHVKVSTYVRKVIESRVVLDYDM
ncbi:MAG: Dabb family protein [Clostridia bacterium]|nr:Dabb family protein [Clostridia bacterium]